MLVKEFWTTYNMGSVVGTVNKGSPQSHLCDPGSIPELTVSCGLILLLVLAWLRGFFSGFSGISSCIKDQHFQFPIRSGRQRLHW